MDKKNLQLALTLRHASSPTPPRMCLTYFVTKHLKKRRAAKDPLEYESSAIPPMPMQQNANGEYVREKPWRSGGLRESDVVGSVVVVERLQ